MQIINKFIFYFLYLTAAELPLFIILLVRATNNTELASIFKILLLISVALNVFIFIYLSILSHKSEVFSEEFITEPIYEGKTSMSDFFTFFLLPFFTFSLTSYTNSNFLFIELFIIFFLLTIYLYRTNNLTSNLLVYAFFNIYSVSTKGKNMTFMVLTPLEFSDYDQGKLIKVTRGIYIYIGQNNKSFLLRSIVLIIVLLVSLATVYILG